MKSVYYCLILGFISVLVLLPLFGDSFYSSHDGEGHVARNASYFQAFKDGQVPPRWAGNLNYGFGTPAFIFYYPLPGYVASMMHFAGISFETAFKLLIGSAFLLAPITMYLWLQKLLSKNAAFFVAILYGFSAYHFLDLYVRGDVAEILAFVFIPLVFYCIERCLHRKDFLFLFLGGVLYALLILSHNGISLMFTPVIFFYGYVRAREKTDLLKIIGILFFGLGISAFFWIPALYESKYLQIHSSLQNLYTHHFPTYFQLVFSQWGFGTNVQERGGLSPQIGPVHILLVLAGLCSFLTDKEKKKIVVYWFIVFFAAVFITTPVSSFLWKQISLLRMFEFPWRFTALSSFAAAMIGGYVYDRYLKNTYLRILVYLALLILSVSQIKIIPQNSKPDFYYLSYLGNTSYHSEATTVWTAGDPFVRPQKTIEVIGGDAVATNIKKKSNYHSLSLDAKTYSQILDNTIYFPGWVVKADGKSVPIEFQDMNHRGLITFFVPQGKYIVTIEFGETLTRKIADMISAISLIIIGFVLSKSLYLKFQTSK